MRVCRVCSATVDETSRTIAGQVVCQRCGAALDGPLPGKPPVVVAPLNPFSDQAGPINPFTNPYATGIKWEPNRVLAQSKVQGPGILLQIYGVLVCLAGFACLALIPLAFAQPNVDDQIGLTVVACLGVAFGVPLGAVTLWGGTKMKRLQSYGLAMAAVVITFVIGFLVCPIAIIAGIWPLVVLLDAEVKACFGTLAK